MLFYYYVIFHLVSIPNKFQTNNCKQIFTNISKKVSGSTLTNWYNSPQCSTDENFCQVVCPYGTTLEKCTDVGNGTTLTPTCDFSTQSCTARQDPGEDGSPACLIECQDPFPASPVQSNIPPISCTFFIFFRKFFGSCTEIIENFSLYKSLKNKRKIIHLKNNFNLISLLK